MPPPGHRSADTDAAICLINFDLAAANLRVQARFVDALERYMCYSCGVGWVYIGSLPSGGGPMQRHYCVSGRREGIRDPVHRARFTAVLGAVAITRDAAFGRKEFICVK
jgi:hypothetical protein